MTPTMLSGDTSGAAAQLAGGKLSAGVVAAKSLIILAVLPLVLVLAAVFALRSRKRHKHLPPSGAKSIRGLRVKRPWLAGSFGFVLLVTVTGCTFALGPSPFKLDRLAPDAQPVTVLWTLQYLAVAFLWLGHSARWGIARRRFHRNAYHLQVAELMRSAEACESTEELAHVRVRLLEVMSNALRDFKTSHLNENLFESFRESWRIAMHFTRDKEVALRAAARAGKQKKPGWIRRSLARFRPSKPLPPKPLQQELVAT